MEDEQEAFVPASIQFRNNGKISYKLLNGEERYRSEKGYTHIPLNMISLKKDVDDLVRLDDMNSPLILHTLRERCKKDKIYVFIRLLTFFLPYVPFRFLFPSHYFPAFYRYAFVSCRIY